MKPMLSAVPRPGFSETAGSCPYHDEACGGLNGLLARSILGGRHLDDVAKRAAECAQARKADVEAHIGHAPPRFAQQEHGSLDSPPLQVAVWSLPKGRLERPDEMRLGDRRDLREVGDVQRLGVAAIDRITSAQHAAVQLLDGPGHPTMLSTSSLPRSGTRPPAREVVAARVPAPRRAGPTTTLIVRARGAYQVTARL